MAGFDPERQAQAPWTKGKMPDVPPGPNEDAPEHLEDVKEGVNRYRRWMSDEEYRAWRASERAKAKAAEAEAKAEAEEKAMAETEARIIASLDMGARHYGHTTPRDAEYANSSDFRQLADEWQRITGVDLSDDLFREFVQNRDIRELRYLFFHGPLTLAEVVEAGREAHSANQQGHLRANEWKQAFRRRLGLGS